MKLKKRSFIWGGLFLLAVVVFFHPTSSHANELPPGMIIGDDQGINATSRGEYHVNVADVRPGKKWHTTISMVNMEKDVPYQLTMLISPPTVSGSLDLSEAIQMTLTYEGKVVYEGPASGINGKQNLQTTPLELGTFSAGDSRALEVDYSLSGDYTKKDFAQKNVMDNVWTYYAVKTTTPDSSSTSGTKPTTIKPSGVFPSTGEQIKQGIIFLCIGLFLVLIVLLMWKKRRETTLNKNRE